MKKIILLFLLFSTFISSCVDKSDPETTLRTFINFRFDGEGKKDKAIDLTTGELRTMLEGLKGEESKNFWGLKNQAKRNIKINIKNCEKEICYLTYTLSYRQKSEQPKSDYNIETKKIAKLEKIENNWLISDVSEVKTFIDSKVELK
jgi:hypothetical protein